MALPEKQGLGALWFSALLVLGASACGADDSAVSGAGFPGAPGGDVPGENGEFPGQDGAEFPGDNGQGQGSSADGGNGSGGGQNAGGGSGAVCDGILIGTRCVKKEHIEFLEASPQPTDPGNLVYDFDKSYDNLGALKLNQPKIPPSAELGEWYLYNGDTRPAPHSAGSW